jgi:hypothetical protein
MKTIPEDFYVPYFELAKKENIDNPDVFEKKLYELEILRRDDSPKRNCIFQSLVSRNAEFVYPTLPRRIL